MWKVQIEIMLKSMGEWHEVNRRAEKVVNKHPSSAGTLMSPPVRDMEWLFKEQNDAQVAFTALRREFPDSTVTISFSNDKE